jgi:hypothetical protein
MTKKCPTHGSLYPCKACARARRTGAPQKPAVPVQQPLDDQVRAARANLLPLKRTSAADAKRHEQMVAADRKADVARRARQLVAEMQRAKSHKRFGLSRRDIADLLKNRALGEGLLAHEIKWLRDLGYKNVNPETLATRLNTNAAGLELILDPLVGRVVANARNRGVVIRHVPDTDERALDADFDKTQAADNAEAESDFAGSVGATKDDNGSDY